MTEIQRTLNSINKILKSSPTLYESPVDGIRNILMLLIDSKSPKRDWARLICRHLNRLMDYNRVLSNSAWERLYDVIVYAVDGRNDDSGIGTNWNRFNRMINLEKELEHRELRFHQKIRQQKCLNQLFSEHQEFFAEYLQKCISLHSKLKVQSLIENIDDLLFKVYKLTRVSITSESQQRLKEKLKCIEINCNFLNRSFENVNSRFSINDNSYNEAPNSLSSFLPSIEQTEINRSDQSKQITDILLGGRWIVILGDPGSAKTTLLRWITCMFAESALNGHEEVVLEGNDCIPIRIPILIRIGEFATWLKQYPAKTLMDYIGEHTWNSERYCHDNNKAVLKELIDHGHALILLDGLDEISVVGQRREIVDLVRKFVDKHMRGPDFTSAFDDIMYNDIPPYDNHQEVVETQQPSIPGGNQIIITSRIVGYQLYPFVGNFIQHYAFLLINDKEAKDFVKKWMYEIEKGVLEVFQNEGVEVDGETVNVLSKRRKNAVKALFENGSELLLSNCSLLSLICTFIFQSPDEFHPKSRVEVYDHAVQVALCSWKTESDISEKVLTDFLIDFACYLHLNSPSGLIDEFDAKQLCYSVLQRQCLSSDRQTLSEYVNKLISLLDFNIGIFAERGLQVFGFLHLSFQEYFVAQSLVKGSPSEIAKRILALTIQPRFRESIFFAIEWICWKWSSDDYDEFCNLLVTSITEYSLPFGTILFFDTFNNVRRLPSNSIIFIALNNILDHPYYPSRTTYLISSLLKLHENIIIEWMQSQLKDEQRLSTFCRCLLQQTKKSDDDNETQINQKSVPSVVYQQLWLLHNISTTVERIIDQTLRTVMRSPDISDQIFNKDLSLYLLSNNISISNTHPLIMSIIIAVCGGVYLQENESVTTIDFSIHYMHRESSILAPIIEYFDNKKESHSTKIQILISKYENIIQDSLPLDTSTDIVDSFIALICLQGLVQPLIYQRYDGYKALLLALDRLQQTWFYLIESCNACISGNNESHNVSFVDSKVESIMNMFFSQPNQSKEQRMSVSIPGISGNNESHNVSFIESKVETIMTVFFSQPNQSEEQRMSFSIACISAWKKIGIWNKITWLYRDNSYNTNANEYFQYPSEFNHWINEEKLDEMINHIHSQGVSHQKSLFLLKFLPLSLQQLYYYAIILPLNHTDSLPLIVFLSQCLTYLERLEKINLDAYLVLPMLYPLLKENMLENYALILFSEKCSPITSKLTEYCEQAMEGITDRTLLYPFLIDESKDLEVFISVERNRIHEAKVATQNQQKDLRLFAASISLVRLFQAKHHSHRYKLKNTLIIHSTESNEVLVAIRNILDPALRIIALNIILEMKDPLIFDEEQRDQLRYEMINQLQSLLPHVSLLKATVLFVRCYKVHLFLPSSFQQMANLIAEKFSKNSINEGSRNQEAAFIALRQLNNSDLSHCLSEFARRTENLSDLLQFHSTTFFHYFDNTTSFGSSNHILLSLMYLFELIFDGQILRMYVENDQRNDISPLNELKQLWNESSVEKKILTYKVATWINNNLPMLNEHDLNQVMNDVSECLIIERKAFGAIQIWLDYRMNKVLNFFAHYAALQLFINSSPIPGLIDIINEIFVIDDEFNRLKLIVSNLMNSQLVNFNVVRQILIILHENAHRSSDFSASISCKEMFELFLNLELERITSNVRRLAKISYKSFLSMISHCSQDLKKYLAKHFRLYLDFNSELEDIIKDEYLAVVFRWMNEKLTEDILIELSKYIFTFIHNGRFPLVGKEIGKALNSVYRNFYMEDMAVCLHDDIIINLEKMIYSSYTCSEDVLAVCLLAYGNRLIKLHDNGMSRNISNKMKNILTVLSERSSLEVTSIRANFCLCFITNADTSLITIFNWFGNRLNMTPEKQYKILVQQTLYKGKNWSRSRLVEEIIDHSEPHSTGLIDLFVVDLYNYLCNKEKLDYLDDPALSYIGIARDIISKKLNEFRNAVQRSIFGEEKFKRELCRCCKSDPSAFEGLTFLYTSFGILTIKFVKMCEGHADNIFFLGERSDLDMSYLKEVAGRNVIDHLFQALDSKTCNRKFKNSLWMLRHLFKIGVISLSEIHQRIPLINNMSYSNENQLWRSERYIFDLLLDVSCFKKLNLSDFKKEFFTKTDIHEEFDNVININDDNLILFIRRNPFDNI